MSFDARQRSSSLLSSLQKMRSLHFVFRLKETLCFYFFQGVTFTLFRTSIFFQKKIKLFLNIFNPIWPNIINLKWQKIGEFRIFSRKWSKLTSSKFCKFDFGSKSRFLAWKFNYFDTLDFCTKIQIFLIFLNFWTIIKLLEYCGFLKQWSFRISTERRIICDKYFFRK